MSKRSLIKRSLVAYFVACLGWMEREKREKLVIRFCNLVHAAFRTTANNGDAKNPHSPQL
jgi:hypothetical protein